MRAARWTLVVLAIVIVSACEAGNLDIWPGKEPPTIAQRAGPGDVPASVCVTLRRGGLGNAFDTYVTASDGGWAPGLYPITWTGGATPHYSLHSFDLSLVPQGAQIVEATFAVGAMWSDSGGSVRAHRVLSPWEEATLTWPAFAGTGAYDPAVLGAFNPRYGGKKIIDLTSLVADWTSGAVENHGILLEEDPTSLHAYFTGESNDPDMRPSLTVWYIPGGPCGGKGDGDRCDDGDPCTHDDTCAGGQCAGSPVSCEALDQCHQVGACDPSTGQCVSPPAQDGLACDDGEPCTTESACLNGACAATVLKPDGALCGPSLASGGHVCQGGACTFDPQLPPITQHFLAGCGVSGKLVIGAGEIAAYRHKNWVIHSGCTVELKLAETVPLSSLIVQTGGALTHSPCTAVGCSRVDLEVASTVDVQPGGTIHADGRGYLGGLQPGNPSQEGESYAGTATSPSCDGSHGGAAIHGAPYLCLEPGVVFDDPRDPRFPGAGGGGTDNSGKPGTPSYVGDNGGGVIRIRAAGTVTLNGILSASGAGGSALGRGGAGGSIRIDAPLLTRTSAGLAIKANGSHAAGGGRVALYGARSGALAVVEGATVQARGGQILTCAAGASGTTFSAPLGATSGGDLAIDTSMPGCVGLPLADATESTYDLSGTIASASPGSLLVDGIRFTPHTLAGRRVYPNIETDAFCEVVDNDESSLQVAGLCASEVGKVFQVEEPAYDRIDVRGPHRVRAARLRAGTIAIVGMLNGAPAKLTTYPASSAAYSRLIVEAQDLTLGPNAQVDVIGRGYLGAWQGDNLSDYGRTAGNVVEIGRSACIGQNPNADCTPLTPWLCCNPNLDTSVIDGCVTTASHAVAAECADYIAHEMPFLCGASHGGRSGDPDFDAYTCHYGCVQPSVEYDSEEEPSMPGGGGAGRTTHPSICKHFQGSNGGGVARIALTGTLTLTSTTKIRADASTCPGWYCSGGAGGSLWVEAAVIVGAPGALISANGTFGNSASNPSYGASGGGGRVSLSASAWIDVDGMIVEAKGGDAGPPNPVSKNGEDGTVLSR